MVTICQFFKAATENESIRISNIRILRGATCML